MHVRKATGVQGWEEIQPGGTGEASCLGEEAIKKGSTKATLFQLTLGGLAASSLLPSSWQSYLHRCGTHLIGSCLSV